jgi:Protein of unknown function (DUF2807).
MRMLIASAMLALSAVAASAQFVIGNGNVVSETRKVPAFTAISVSGSGVLRVHRGPQKVVLTCDSNVMPLITTTVSHGELSIGFKPFASIMNAHKFEFDVTIPELSGLSQSGSGDSFIDAFSGDTFSGSISGSGGMQAKLDYGEIDLHSSGSAGFDATIIAKDFKYRSSGSGSSQIRGGAEKAELGLSGSSDFSGQDFSVDSGTVSISGSGHVDIRANKSLVARLSGSGSLRYWGDARVDQRTSGSGHVEKAD